MSGNLDFERQELVGGQVLVSDLGIIITGSVGQFYGPIFISAGGLGNNFQIELAWGTMRAFHIFDMLLVSSLWHSYWTSFVSVEMGVVKVGLQRRMDVSSDGWMSSLVKCWNHISGLSGGGVA
ncbi:hypothetical protein FIBSPDRAFT_881429 [Athelia psychrophila]|uniref:Uncharacterized protein n=1 Tax=Athelia psychrophila TaxID=1759441 RepID=A0A166WNN6_9AGAM|nr:hypothetical protein FIBSPDRAFT_881429 [Fibularhizoctonia sp. CBS 109695]